MNSTPVTVTNAPPSRDMPVSAGRHIFREEALLALQPRLQGEVIVVPRMGMWWWCLLALVILATLAWFVTHSSYTRRSTVAGQLVPQAGILRVQTPQAGVIIERKVVEGQVVRKGDVLFVLSSDRVGSGAREIQQEVSREIAQRRLSMQSEIARNQKAQSDDLIHVERRISGLQKDAQTIERQIEQQRRRVEVAQDIKNRYQGLADQDYIAKEQLIQKELELSEQQSRLQALERDVQATQRELATAARDIDSTKSRYANLNSGLQRTISSSQQELTEVDSRRRVVVTAPEDGRATLLAGDVGQVADVSRPLVSLVPIQNPLQARLFAPSRTIGFVRPGDKVLLRYQAYPYQKFGLHDGTVLSISTTAVPSTELGGFAIPELAPGEPVYAITVALKSQSVMAYGQPQALQAGQRLDADILQETRKLYEWMLEPLYSITGKMER
ncbi:MAG: HlyD family efflux transporter periplasmic adaptor subunit [Burkholderiaceae bacterium]